MEGAGKHPLCQAPDGLRGMTGRPQAAEAVAQNIVRAGSQVLLGPLVHLRGLSARWALVSPAACEGLPGRRVEPGGGVLPGWVGTCLGMAPLCGGWVA